MIKKLSIGCLGILFSINTVFAADSAALIEDNLHKAVVLETKNAGSYTYIKVKESDKEYWAAVPSAKINVGDKITLKKSTWMVNFKSKTLNQTFDKIMFADINGKKKTAIHGVDNVHGIHGQLQKKEPVEKPNPNFKNITLSDKEAVKTTISDLYDSKDKFKNTNVEVQGEVIQVSNKVMGNTWVKIFDGKDAVIFRSPNEDEKVKKGDKVKVVGTVNTDVDYGYGFKYEIIGVNAKFTKVN